MDLEFWVINLFKAIKAASLIDANFDLHLEIDEVKKIASAYDLTDWIEIY